MKKIYIVITHTGTILSKIIRKYSKAEYTHISISLDKELKEMYSFGRLNPYNAFWGGFVHEYIDKGTFKRFYNTQAKICSLEITDEQYKTVKEVIKQFEKNKKNYKFNVIGLFAAGFNKKIERENSFYCAEFVKYVLKQAKINIKLPDIIKPEDFKNIKELHQIYNGLLKEYNVSEIN